jgi:hypothetical protein
MAHVGLVHIDGTTQMALVLGGLLGQDVTLEGLTALDGATGTNTETLCSALLSLHFGHDCSSLMTFAGRHRKPGALDGLRRLVFILPVTRPAGRMLEISRL